MKAIVTIEQAIEMHGRVLWFNYRENAPWIAQQRAIYCKQNQDFEGFEIWQKVAAISLSLKEAEERALRDAEPLPLRSLSRPSRKATKIKKQ